MITIQVLKRRFQEDVKGANFSLTRIILYSRFPRLNRLNTKCYRAKSKKIDLGNFCAEQCNNSSVFGSMQIYSAADYSVNKMSPQFHSGNESWLIWVDL